MATISTFSGLASGIQWRDMIDKIMQLETQRKLTPVSNRIASNQSRKEAWNSFRGLLKEFSTATAGLRDGTGFQTFKTAVTGTQFTATASTASAPGNYAVRVQTLAKQEKVAGSAVASTTAALGLSGTFHVNGRAVAISAEDSVAAVRDKINAVNSGSAPSGVTASILKVSETEQYLVLTADQTGTRGIELVDSASSGGVLESLGVLDGGAPEVANTSLTDPTRHQTQRFTSQATPLAQMLGLTSPPAVASILVDGERVSVDLENDSLQDLLTKIDAAMSAAAKSTESTIVSEQVGGATRYRLETGAVAVDGAAPAESQRLLEMLGFVREARADVRQVGDDAVVEIDGFAVSRRTNTITDAIDGVTLTLKETGTSASDLSISRNLDGIVSSVQALAEKFNALVAFQKEQTAAGAPLYASGTLRSAINSIKNVLLSPVPGLDPAVTEFTRSTIAGLSLTREGKLELDTAVLRDALATNFSEVKALFGVGSSSSNGQLSFIYATEAVRAGSYEVELTQLATLASHTGSAWSGTYDGSGPDEMTITDAYTGKTASIGLLAGDTVASVTGKLNQLFATQGMTLSASAGAGDELIITGGEFGSVGGFTVSYQQGGTTWSGVEPTGFAAGTYVGLDVAGTINGEAATGAGRVLAGAAGTSAEGLSVSYAGTATGVVGSLEYRLGLVGEMELQIQALASSGDGILDGIVAGIDTSTGVLEEREDSVISRLERYEQSLIEQFTAMEVALSRIQAQSEWLSSQVAAMQAFNSAAAKG